MHFHNLSCFYDTVHGDYVICLVNPEHVTVIAKMIADTIIKKIYVLILLTVLKRFR